MASVHPYQRLLDQGRDPSFPSDRALAATPVTYSSATGAAGSPVILLRKGEAWMICGDLAAPLWVKDSKGLGYLSTLVRNPRCQFHVLTLIGAEHRPGDAGSMLDTQARREYRARFEDLRELIAQAEALGDSERVNRIQEELEALGGELRRAVGLGGKERRAVSGVERARINVQRCIKDAINRISNHNAGLGRYLAATVRTGTTCAFTPL